MSLSPSLSPSVPAALTHRRGIETNLELCPGEAATEGGRNPLGGVLNEQAMSRVEELETENTGLRSMLVDLQVMMDGPCSQGLLL